jgi:spore coat protein U-like protein
MFDKKYLFSVFISMTLIYSFTQAACGLSILAGNISTTWTATWSMQSVSITVSKTNPAACTFGLAFSKGGAGNYSRYASSAALQLSYQLYGDAGALHVLREIPDLVSTNDVVMVTLPAGSGPQIIQYYFDIPYASATTPFLAGAGTYTDNIVISAYEGADPSLYVNPADATAAVAISVLIEKQINLSFVDLGGVFQDNAVTKNIEFGSLRTGNVSRFNMAVRTNAGFSITLASTNAGQFKHATTATFIPYSVTVNNVAADLTGVVPVVTGSGQTSLSGLVYPVGVTIGATGTLPVAGTYSDSIVVTAIVTD